MRPIKAVPFQEADERFKVRSLFHLGRNDDAEVVVFTGNTTLENLPLDFSHLDSWSGLMKTHPDMFLGVVVDGDLTVTDWITNWEWDFGPFLLVRGNVRAKNFATAGSEVLIEGNLEVTQTIAGIYNHGRTVIKGDARAEVVLTNEHLTEFHGRLTAELGIAGTFSGSRTRRRSRSTAGQATSATSRARSCQASVHGRPEHSAPSIPPSGTSTPGRS